MEVPRTPEANTTEKEMGTGLMEATILRVDRGVFFPPRKEK